MCNWAVYSGNTTWSHFHSCNILVVKYKSQNVFIQKSFCDLFLLLFFLILLLRNGERREVGGEAEGKMHGL